MADFRLPTNWCHMRSTLFRRATPMFHYRNNRRLQCKAGLRRICLRITSRFNTWEGTRFEKAFWMALLEKTYGKASRAPTVVSVTLVVDLSIGKTSRPYWRCRSAKNRLESYVRHEVLCMSGTHFRKSWHWFFRCFLKVDMLWSVDFFCRSQVEHVDFQKTAGKSALSFPKISSRWYLTTRKAFNFLVEVTFFKLAQTESK
jgi:hypothetical protein